MGWKDDSVNVVFECDTCDAVETVEVAKARFGSTAPEGTSNFILCWSFMQGIGWRSLKRIGHPWTFHCIKCGPQAEVDHREHKRREAERDRLKVRNSRD